MPGRLRLTINAQPEDIHRWLDSLCERFEGQPVAIAVEASKGPVVNTLLGRDWLTIYPVHPATSRRFSKAFTPSGAAHDQPDADNLLEILELHRHRLRALLPQDQITRQLTALVESRRHIVDDRTRLGNQVTSLLKGYFPQALELTGDTRYSKMAIAFLTRWPDLDSVRKVRPETLRSFYHLHQVRRPELIEHRLNAVREARQVSADPVLTQSSTLYLQYLLDQLRALLPALARIDAKIDEVFASHADKEIFESLPGAGPAMAPRLCVLFGVDRERWQNAGQLQKYYGIAPVIEASNKRVWTHWRWSAPTFKTDARRVGRPQRKAMCLGQGILQGAGEKEKIAFRHYPQSGLQMAPNSIPLLERQGALQRQSLRQSTEEKGLEIRGFNRCLIFTKKQKFPCPDMLRLWLISTVPPAQKNES